MVRQPKQLLSLARQHLWASSLALFALGLILWAGETVWARPCHLAGGSNCPLLLLDLEPLLLALGFWVTGLIVRIRDRKGAATTLFLLCAAGLAAGKLSAMGNDTGGRLFYVLLAWLAPVTFHFHHALLDRPLGRLGRCASIGLYGLALVGSLPFLLWPVITLESLGWFAGLRLGVRLALALALALGWSLLLRDYRRAPRRVQSHIRLTVFGTLLAAAPLALLSLLPETLGAPAHLPYEWTLPWLLLAPLSYAYALFRRRLPKAEATLNRLAAYYLAITLFLGFYLMMDALLVYLTQRPFGSWPLGSALLGVGLVLLFAPMKGQLERLIVWVLYGGEIRYTRVVGSLSEALALALDRQALHDLLLVEWPRLMRLTRVLALLRDTGEALTFFGLSGEPPPDLSALQMPADGQLSAYLRSAPPPVLGQQVRRALSQVSLNEDEAALLALPEIAYWLPLVSGGALQGLLLVGQRAEDDPFSAEDERILATLAHQAGIAAHNVRLIEEIRLARQELAAAHRQLLLEQDQSQRRLALELHDEGIQGLLGITFQLNAMQQTLERPSRRSGQAALRQQPAEILRSVHTEVLALVAYLRALTYELHPPGLEEVGLTLALESYVHHLKSQDGQPTPLLELEMDKIGPADLSLPLATSIFRAAQEALRNALHHARSQHVAISLRRSPNQVLLSVCDDGCGFRVPARLSELARRGHFGLVGMAERVAWAGGELEIRSLPGSGTDVIVRLPLEAERPADGEKTIH